MVNNTIYAYRQLICVYTNGGFISDRNNKQSRCRAESFDGRCREIRISNKNIYITGSSADVQYGLALADNINDNDVTMENNGIKIVIASDVAVGFTDGSIDFVDDRTGKNFIIQNAESGTCDNCDECGICDAD